MLARKALAGTAGAPKEYVEDVFSTYLYTGTGSNQTITNGIDISGKGGAVWLKGRSVSYSHRICDTERGATKRIIPNSTDGEDDTGTAGITGFTSSGFSIGTDIGLNQSSSTYTSWTFRKAKKFFDVVTYTGDGSTSKNISHNLGSVPGCIMVKCTSTTHPWRVYHRSLGNTKALALESTDSEYTSSTVWDSTTPTSTVFTVGDNAFVNANGATYVAYLFAHDAGGFGASGSDNVITCGSYTGNGSTSGPTVTLNYEPQWIMIKNASTTGSWQIIDNMRGMVVSGNDQRLIANSSSAELSNNYLSPTATGFTLVSDSSEVNGNGNTMIYIAIRRGPMKTPTSGTSVYSGVARDGTSAAATITGVGFAPDLVAVKRRDDTGAGSWQDRLRGPTIGLTPSATDAEDSGVGSFTSFTMDGAVTGTGANSNVSGRTYINHFFKRAPGVFDVVCYTGNGSARTITHNLGTTPELMIVKSRSSSSYVWAVYNSSVGATKYLRLTSNIGSSTESNIWNDTDPTSSVFTVGTGATVNENNGTYVAYLFASVTGVSKVGTYTGNGSNQTINCGFTAGARFILIKRTDSTGDWYLYDSARGIVSGNDPQLKLNSSAAEDTGYDAIDPDNSGFIVNNNATNFPINVNAATYIYLAIA